MRLPLWALALLTAVAIASCSGPANTALNTAIPSPTATFLPPVTLASPSRTTASSGGRTTSTPRATIATRTPLSAPAFLDIEGQQLPVPAGAKETKNIPAVARNYAQNQLRGQSRVGEARAFLLQGGRSEAAQTYLEALGGAGWDAVPLAGLIDPLDVLFAQKANVRATIVFATEDSASTLMYIVATRR